LRLFWVCVDCWGCFGVCFGGCFNRRNSTIKSSSLPRQFFLPRHAMKSP
jgi:hypothetical protein